MKGDIERFGQHFDKFKIADVKSEDAHKRAVEDYSQFSQFVRMTAQLVFAANGAAAGATLSFLTAIINSGHITTALPRSIRIFVISSLFFIAGLVLSMVSMHFFNYSKLYHGRLWEDAAKTGKLDRYSYFSKRAWKYHIWGQRILLFAMLSFIPGAATELAAFLTLRFVSH